MQRIASIDSGASKTDILILKDIDTIYISRFDISLNIHNQPITLIQQNLKHIIGLLEENRVEEIVWGLAGLDTHEDYRIWQELLSKYTWLEHHILHDVEMALYAAEYTGKGILIVAGTGSNVYGFDGVNRIKCGNWGALYGDDFSGYRLARNFLNIILHIYDGRLDNKHILNEFLDYLGIGSEDLPRWIYNSSISEVAALAPFICKKVDEDLIRKIMDEILMEMELAVKTVINRLSHRYPIHYTGGLFKCNYIRKGLEEMCLRNGWILGFYIEYPVLGGVSYLMSRANIDELTTKKVLDSLYREIKSRIP